MPLVLTALMRPLAPQMGDSAALCVGPALLALLSAAPAQAAVAAPSLLAALAAKIAAVQVSPVVTGGVGRARCPPLNGCVLCFVWLPPSNGETQLYYA